MSTVQNFARGLGLDRWGTSMGSCCHAVAFLVTNVEGASEFAPCSAAYTHGNILSGSRIPVAVAIASSNCMHSSIGLYWQNGKPNYLTIRRQALLYLSWEIAASQEARIPKLQQQLRLALPLLPVAAPSASSVVQLLKRGAQTPAGRSLAGRRVSLFAFADLETASSTLQLWLIQPIQ